MSGRYRRIRVVGKGSFGCCWLVETETREPCILKAIDISKMPEKQKEEAANEVKVLSKLRHPFIINYRESYVEDGLLCIITDFADSGDLYNIIHRQKRCAQNFAESVVLRWFTQISLALKHMHDRRVLHRDLKTQNIFMAGSGHGTIKIGDFGIARVLQHTQDCARTAIGTPYYLSPEICQEKPYGYKSDIWSLGCVLYELASLQHAFDADSMRGLVMKILKGIAPQVPCSFSPELRLLVPEMLTKDPNKRPSINQVLQHSIVRTQIRQLLLEEEHRARAAHPGFSPPGGDREHATSKKSRGARDADKSGARRSTPLGAVATPLRSGGVHRSPAAVDRRECRADAENSRPASGKPGSSPTGSTAGEYSRVTGHAEMRVVDDQSRPPISSVRVEDKHVRSGVDVVEGHKREDGKLHVDAVLAKHYERRREKRSEHKHERVEEAHRSQHSQDRREHRLDGERKVRSSKAPGESCSAGSRRRKDPLANDGRSRFPSSVHPQAPIVQGSGSSANSGSTHAPGSKPLPFVVSDSIRSDMTQLCQEGLSRRDESVPVASVEALGCSQLMLTLQEGLNLQDCGEVEEDSDQKALTFPRFLRPDSGEALQLPMVQDGDSVSYKIEALRIYLEQELGLVDFLCVYRYLDESALEAPQGPRLQPLEDLVSAKAIEFLPLVHQLVVCEDVCFGGQLE